MLGVGVRLFTISHNIATQNSNQHVDKEVRTNCHLCIANTNCVCAILFLNVFISKHIDTIIISYISLLSLPL